MSKSLKTIAAGEFKTKCLSLMDSVKEDQITIVITKRGKPVAKLVPVKDSPIDKFGCMGNTVTIKGDIVSPLDEDWEVDS